LDLHHAVTYCSYSFFIRLSTVVYLVLSEMETEVELDIKLNQ
jgi:hypothetical protein